MKTIKEIAILSIQLQDASNVQALVRTWAEWMPVIRSHSEEQRISFNEHPVNVMMASKMASLTGSDSMSCFQAAYKEVQRLTREG